MSSPDPRCEMADHDEMVAMDAKAQGHREAMQEVLGYLRKEFEQYLDCRDLFMTKSLCETAVEYHKKARHIKAIVKDLFGDEEFSKMRTIY